MFDVMARSQIESLSIAVYVTAVNLPLHNSKSCLQSIVHLYCE